MKRTLKRELKGLEIAEREAIGFNTCQHQFSPKELARREVEESRLESSFFNLLVVLWTRLRENVSGC